MEEKKKTNQTNKKKTTTTKKANATKKTSAKKVAPKASPKKTNQPKKKPQVKKNPPKKIEKKVVKEETPKIKVTEEEARLEKTIIFDGNQRKNLREVVEKLEEENVVVDDKVIKRSKFNRIAVIVLAIAMVLVAAGATAYVLSQKEIERKNRQTLNSNIYEKIKNNNIEIQEETKDVSGNDYYENIQTITLSQFENKVLNKENMAVLVASSTCYDCIAFEPTINKVFKDINKKIYRLDIVEFNQEEINRFRTYYSFTSTPTIFIVKDGVVTADLVKSQTEKDLKDWIDKNF